MPSIELHSLTASQPHSLAASQPHRSLTVTLSPSQFEVNEVARCHTVSQSLSHSLHQSQTMTSAHSQSLTVTHSHSQPSFPPSIHPSIHPTIHLTHSLIVPLSVLPLPLPPTHSHSFPLPLTVHSQFKSLTVVHCRSLSFTVVHCRSLSLTVVLCRPLPQTSHRLPHTLHCDHSLSQTLTHSLLSHVPTLPLKSFNSALLPSFVHPFVRSSPIDDAMQKFHFL